MNQLGRLNLRLDSSLVCKIRKYAARRHTTVSALIRQMMLELLERDEQEQAKQQDAEQI